MDSGAIPAELTHSGAIPAESNHSGAIPADSGAIPADSGGFRRNYQIPDGICGALKSTAPHLATHPAPLTTSTQDVNDKGEWTLPHQRA